MANVFFQQGCQAMAAGGYTDAVRLFREALGLNSRIPELWNNTGIALFAVGERREAIEAFRHAIDIAPRFAEAHNNLGHSLAECGKLAEGLTACREALSLNPLLAEAHNNAGIILTGLGRYREALRHLSRSCELAPGFVAAWNNRGNAQKELGWLSAAVTSYRKALDLVPECGDTMAALAALYQQRGVADRAVSYLRKAVQLSPDNPHIHSNLIMAMNYSPHCSQLEIAEESRLWGCLHGEYFSDIVSEKRQLMGRRVRIGYVSADLHRHPVGTFLKEILKNHDKTAFEITCYQNGTRSDVITAELRQSADRWRLIAGMSDDEAVSLISSDGIDILVDLSGHTGGNRLSLFARKPAPIQATWLGYFHTTGLRAIDYLLTDAITVPFDEDAYYTERLIRLKPCRFCYSPPAPAPFVDDLPALTNGFVTFGSFNNIAKLTPHVVSLWARVLLAVPGSRLVLKWKSFERSAVQKRYLSLFGTFGIKPERIEFRGASSHFLALAEYNDIDIALDTFPFNGGLTSCEAMWMGVPVVTLSGTTPIGRQTSSFLAAVDLAELIAVDEGDYIKIAASLAGDLEYLAGIREGLREKMASSPLCNGDRFTRDLEEAYRVMVREKSLDENTDTEWRAAHGNNADDVILAHDSSTKSPSLYRQVIEPNPQKRLRVCYLFPDNTSSKIATLLATEILPLHNREELNIFIYDDSAVSSGEMLKRVKNGKTAGRYRYTGNLANSLFARLLQRDGIDILVDLTQEGTPPRRGPLASGGVPVRLGLSDLPAMDGAPATSGETWPWFFFCKDKAGHVMLLESAYREKWLDHFVKQRKPRRRMGRRTIDRVRQLIQEGRALRLDGRLEDAEARMVEAVSCDPHSADAYRNFGEVLVYQGKLAEGMASFRRALVLDPSLFKARSNLLFVMNYSDRCTAREIYAESVAWEKAHVVFPTERKGLYSNTAEPERKLRIGYVSSDFYRHAVSYFFEPLLCHHDRGKFEVVCYSCVEQPDETTARLKRMASQWRECAGLDDVAIAQMVRDDRIDILVDLAGHTGARIRLPVFGEKPAPVQVSWLGYPNTTGLSTIDYRFTDALADPEGESDRWHTERLVRLSDGFLCYRPSDEAPNVMPPPIITNGFITFGSFNMLPKLSASTVAVWSRLLRLVPDARLLLKCHSFRDAATRDRVDRSFQRWGITSDRIKLVGTLPSIREHLALYSEVDLALDPFPYNGTTTTCEAIWMGVPVITLLGQRHAGRVGADILRSLCLDELVAVSFDDYLERAVALSQSIERLTDYRMRLRPLMTGSSLCDGRLFAKNIEAAYRDIWLSWCQSRSGSP